MMKPTLLAILGSPHRNGITAQMLNCAVSAAKDAGWNVVSLHLYDKHLAFCIGCCRCQKTQHCVQKDDLEEIAAALRSCDVVALAAPTYWGNVPAIVKNMFDRLYGAAMEETGRFPKPLFSPKQKYLLLTSCNTPFPFAWLCNQSRGALRAMDEFFKTSGLKCMGRVVCASAKNKTTLPRKISNRIFSYWK